MYLLFILTALILTSDTCDRCYRLWVELSILDNDGDGGDSDNENEINNDC